MKYYVVIDTNVLVSALLKWNSVPGNVLQLTFDGPIVPVLNTEIENEYREVLARSKFHFNDEIINAVLDAINSKAIYVDAESIDIELPDPKDKVFYEVVMEVRKDEDAYLVTGNMKHFPNKPFIVTPKELINIILAETESDQGRESRR